MDPGDLPAGAAPLPVPAPHFPSRLHAFVWRNWPLVPVERLAAVVGAPPEAIRRIGAAMGLPEPAPVSEDQWRRSALTIIRRNWHLLPYEQLLALLDWTPEQMAFTLREDDFLFIKLGSLKPRCEPLSYQPPDAAARRREQEIAALLRDHLPDPAGAGGEPLFSFVSHLATAPEPSRSPNTEHRTLNTGHPTPNPPRFCYSYFALYGDPLLDEAADPYPDGYLARLAEIGVNGVWLQGVLYHLAPFPWDAALSDRWEERRGRLRALVQRAAHHGMGIYLYLNEPRAMPLAFFSSHPELKGMTEGDHAALCTSHPAVQQYLTDAVASLCRAVPNLAGLFTITASENLTNCWSHGRGGECPRCGARSPAAVIAEVNACIQRGIDSAGSGARLIVWDWGWRDEDAPALIEALPERAALMSVSEWSLPVERGGVETTVGEYALSVIGPGPRARRHWELARRRGLRTLAKMQLSNTWELSAVPYLPVVENVARHVANLRGCGINGMMLGWTLGGYPSPNLEVVAELEQAGPDGARPDPDTAMTAVARRRFGAELAPAVVEAWKQFSAAFREFPYHGGVVYLAPLQMGPANPLWETPTGYRATMVGFPYDDLASWRSVYPPEVFIAQLEKVADGFDLAIERLRQALPPGQESANRGAWEAELRVAEAAAIHFRSVALQAQFVLARDALAGASIAAEALPLLEELERVLTAESALARRLHAIQAADSRIGFEASNQYYYLPVDLAEKLLNCHDLLTRWLPHERRRRGLA